VPGAALSLCAIIVATAPSAAALAAPEAPDDAGTADAGARDASDGAFAEALDDPSPAGSDDGRWGFAALPRFTISSDDGLGLGVRGTAFWYRWDTSPYKTAISFQLWATTNLVQHHYVRIDALDAFNVPLRLEAEAGLFQTLSLNFCGLGDRSVCADEGTASKVRYIAPYASALARLRLVDAPIVQLAGGWRGTAYVPGTWGDFSPYPGSAYALIRPGGEEGFTSQLLAGAVFDTRDYEPAPTKGIAASLVVRAADPLLGSTWRFAGGNAQLLVFSPLARNLVLAQRLVADVIVGDAPIVELMKTGGLQESFAYGGQDFGRGLRLARFVGAVKVMAQEELRFDLFHIDAFGNDVGVGAALFLDVGAVSATLEDFSQELPVPAWGAGVALRASWNRNFLMRIDVALSPVEGARVGLYTAPGHPF
jgi:hypothetical protein